VKEKDKNLFFNEKERAKLTKSIHQTQKTQGGKVLKGEPVRTSPDQSPPSIPLRKKT